MKEEGSRIGGRFLAACVWVLVSACLPGSGDLPEIRGSSNTGRGPQVVLVLSVPETCLGAGGS